MDYTLNVKGQLMSLREPKVMGILNVTPDSFYAESRVLTKDEIISRARLILDQGGSIIDVGACSTRPGSTPVAQAEEMDRLRMALGALRRVMPDAVISVDTFRPDVARLVVEEYGVDMINDVGGGQPDMLRMVSRLQVPYVLMSSEPTMREMLMVFAAKIQQLRDMGHKDIILDPGFGFGKTLEQNYDIMRQLEDLSVLDLPLLVGISRKSMIHRLLNSSAEHSLNGSTVLNTVALMKGASILRVHDVREAAECMSILKALSSTGV